jgi:hypothetical protein
MSFALFCVAIPCTSVSIHTHHCMHPLFQIVIRHESTKFHQTIIVAVVAIRVRSLKSPRPSSPLELPSRSVSKTQSQPLPAFSGRPARQLCQTNRISNNRTSVSS